MTSTQALIGLFWLPGVIGLIFVGYLYWQHRKYTPNNSRMPDIFNNGDDYITDGFGSYWWAFCQVCNKRSMVVVRPGRVECEYGCELEKCDQLNDKSEDNRT